MGRCIIGRWGIRCIKAQLAHLAPGLDRDFALAFGCHGLNDRQWRFERTRFPALPCTSWIAATDANKASSGLHRKEPAQSPISWQYILHELDLACWLSLFKPKLSLSAIVHIYQT
jgi:hypothetical protein